MRVKIRMRGGHLHVQAMDSADSTDVIGLLQWPHQCWQHHYYVKRNRGRWFLLMELFHAQHVCFSKTRPHGYYEKWLRAVCRSVQMIIAATLFFQAIKNFESWGDEDTSFRSRCLYSKACFAFDN